jgi:hypothetical protein
MVLASPFVFRFEGLLRRQRGAPKLNAEQDPLHPNPGSEREHEPGRIEPRSVNGSIADRPDKYVLPPPVAGSGWSVGGWLAVDDELLAILPDLPTTDFQPPANQFTVRTVGP